MLYMAIYAVNLQLCCECACSTSIRFNEASYILVYISQNILVFGKIEKKNFGKYHTHTNYRLPKILVKILVISLLVFCSSIVKYK